MTITNRQTTVTIDQETSKKLDRLATTNALSKKEFINQALDYFERFGINPTQNETPILEMDRIRKRQDQVIAFLRAQEKNILEPSLLGMAKADESLRFQLAEFRTLIDALTTKELSESNLLKIGNYLKKITEHITSNTEKVGAQIERKILNYVDTQNKNQKKIENTLVEIARHLDKKGKEGILDKVSNLLK